MKYPTTAVLALSLLLGACSTAPVSFNGVTPTPMGDAYTCAVQQLNQLGYTVQDAEREAGFVRGSKRTSGVMTTILSNENHHDVLTVSIFEPTDGEETRMRVTAGRMAEQAFGFGRGDDSAIAPSDEGKADANILLEQCQVAQITEGD